MAKPPQAKALAAGMDAVRQLRDQLFQGAREDPDSEAGQMLRALLLSGVAGVARPLGDDEALDLEWTEERRRHRRAEQDRARRRAALAESGDPDGTGPRTSTLSGDSGGMPTLSDHADDAGGTSALSATISERKLAANRGNALKSTGPRTGEGKQRVTQNLFGGSTRLLGMAETRALNLEPDAAGKLFRDLIAPFEPAPVLLVLHFQDYARLQLELQAWERIRDAMVEDRAQQNRLEIRRRFQEMDQELKATAGKVIGEGLCRQPDSPGKFRKQIQCLDVLKSQLARRDFEALSRPLAELYGKGYNPDYERGQLICADCGRLMNEKDAPLTDGEMETLLTLVGAELGDAENGYELQLDERTLTASGAMARLAPGLTEGPFLRYGEQLRRAIDRNKRLTPTLLKMLGLAQKCRPTPEAGPAKDPELGPPAPKATPKI
jgi:hypothetical protein